MAPTTANKGSDGVFTITGGSQPPNMTHEHRSNLADQRAEFVKRSMECYNMNHKSRGRCIIISHTRFQKANNFKVPRQDVKELVECFQKQLHFKSIAIYTDDNDTPDSYYGNIKPNKVRPLDR